MATKHRIVIEIGSAVSIGTNDDPIGAVVHAVSLRGEGGAVAQYECVWWDGKTRKSEWVGEGEIIDVTQPNARKMSVGFGHASGA